MVKMNGGHGHTCLLDPPLGLQP